MKLTWFGHSAFRVEIGGAVIMIDPFLANPTFKGSHPEAWAGATHVVLTHGHDDHIGSTVEICKATGATLIANFEVCVYLAGKGVADYSPGNHGGEVDHGPFTVAFVPAWHSSSTIVEGTPVYLGNAAGVVIKAPGEPTLLHMGDTDIFSDMGLINEIHRPQVGIVPIGDRFTMGGRIAALACKRFYDFDTVIPCHYATFGMIDPDEAVFADELKKHGVRAKLVVPERGKAVTF